MNIFWEVTSGFSLPLNYCLALSVFLSLTYSSIFLFLWDWEKGKRSLAVRWNALIAIWTPVSLRILNWPAVMSQYSELGDPSPPHTYQLSPRLSLAVLPGQLVNVGCCSWDWEPLEMYASEDRYVVLEIQVITVAENACSREATRAIGYFVPPLSLTSVHSITLMSPLLCHWDSSSFLLSFYPLTNLTADPLICCLFLCLSSSPRSLTPPSPTRL